LYTVYKHTSPSNKVYIGITSRDVEKRWRNGDGYKSNPHFYNAIKKYEWESFQHDILYENLTKEEAENIEQKLIKEYKSYLCQFGYNRDMGGNCKGKVSESTKKKMGEAHKGNKNALGAVRSEEFKRKLSERAKQQVLSKESREKISASVKRLWKNEAYRNNTISKLKGRSSPTKGKKASEETKKKLSESHKGIKLSEEAKAKISKPVVQLSLDGEYINTYKSQSEAQRVTGVWFSNISKCCRHQAHVAGGYTWVFAEEYLENIQVA
jgi:group I intron endonuclease